MAGIPNIESAPAYDAQAIADASDWQTISQGFAVTGIISGCVVSAYGAPAMGIAVSAGSVACSGIVTAVAAASVTIPAASASDRRDIIIALSSGAASVVTGNPCGTAGWTKETYPGYPPVKATIPANCVYLGEVYVAATTTSIASANILLSGVELLVTGAYVTSFNNRSGPVTLQQSDVESTFTAAGQIPVGTGVSTGEYLTSGSVGYVLTSTGAGAVPSWQMVPGSGAASAGVQSFNTRFGPVTFLLADAESVYTAKGQIMVGTGTNTAELLSPSASVGYVLTSNGSASVPSWQAAPASGSVAAASVTAGQIQATFTGAGQIYVGTGASVGEQLSAGSVSTVLTSTGSASVPSWQPLPAQAMTLISAQILNSTAASITFSAIPQTYHHLLLMAVARSSQGSEADNFCVRVNGDGAEHYGIVALQGAEAGAVTDANNISPYWLSVNAGDLPGTSSTATVPGQMRLEIPAYTGLTFEKVGHWTSGYLDLATSTSDWLVTQQNLLWQSTAAITSLTVFPASNLVFSIGSSFYLYGIL